MLLSEMLFIPVTCQHSILGIAPPAPMGFYEESASILAIPKQSTAQPPVTHSKWASLPASPAAQGWGDRQEIYRRVVQPATTCFLSLKALLTTYLTRQPEQRHMSRHGKSLHFNHGDCTLVRWLNTSCVMQMCPSSLQRSISWRQLHPVCPVNCCDWPCTDNTGIQHSSSKRELWRGTEQIKHPVLWEKQTTYRRSCTPQKMQSSHSTVRGLAHMESTAIRGTCTLYRKQVPAPWKHSWGAQEGIKDPGQWRNTKWLSDIVKGIREKQQMARWHVSAFVRQLFFNSSRLLWFQISLQK